MQLGELGEVQSSRGVGPQSIHEDVIDIVTVRTILQSREKDG